MCLWLCRHGANPAGLDHCDQQAGDTQPGQGGGGLTEASVAGARTLARPQHSSSFFLTSGQSRRGARGGGREENEERIVTGPETGADSPMDRASERTEAAPRVRESRYTSR
ncbi:unnamed protein product [Pleuronectes platessa]|uniref:Uncharacterized protein n=1 Tax=Pleuronectes platessa TaxID=8262 RepID=A0A9N7YHH9_PLEPL|nr:unnamed protein product [Pleuronectes platessa]